jgi:DNA polymerase-3 subunit delta
LAKETTGATFDSLKIDISSRKLLPLYCFCGEEPYFVDVLTELVEKHSLTETEKAFNLSIFYGKDISVQTLIEACTRPPMMAEKQVVIVKEAQGLESKKSEDQTILLRYFKQPLPSTILVLAFKNAAPDKRLNVWKELCKSPGYYEGKKLYEHQLGAFIKKFLAEKKIKIDERAIELLIENTGNELTKIVNELSKIALSKEAGSTILQQDIEREVGISKEFSVFELTHALAVKDADKAFRITHFLSQSKHHPAVLIIGQLYSFFSKIYLAHAHPHADDKNLSAVLKVSPYFIKEYKAAMVNYPLPQILHILQLLSEYDLRSKGVGSTGNISDGELIREMVFRIITEKTNTVKVEFNY